MKATNQMTHDKFMRIEHRPSTSNDLSFNTGCVAATIIPVSALAQPIWHL